MLYNYNKDNLKLLSEEEELQIVKKLSAYPDIIKKSAERYEPHLLANYMRELAQEIHSYYNKFQILVEDNNLRNARLALVKASRHVLKNSGNIIGINMPDKM
jgi:arginyl-tRNA synthetase